MPFVFDIFGSRYPLLLYFPSSAFFREIRGHPLFLLLTEFDDL